MTQRSGCRQRAEILLMRMADELEARMTSGGNARSKRSNSSTFRSSRSGALSCTNSAPFTAAAGSRSNRILSGEALGPRPRRVSVGQAVST
jgi:hypothetical protein